MDITVNWDAVGAIAEFMAAIAVIATLLYLAIQVRQSRSLLEETRKIALSQVHQARGDARRSQQMHIADSQFLVKIISRVQSADDPLEEMRQLNGEDFARFRSHLIVVYLHQEDNLYQNELSLLDSRTLDVTSNTILYFMPLWKEMGMQGTGRVDEWFEKIIGEES